MCSTIVWSWMPGTVLDRTPSGQKVGPWFTPGANVARSALLGFGCGAAERERVLAYQGAQAVLDRQYASDLHQLVINAGTARGWEWVQHRVHFIASGQISDDELAAFWTDVQAGLTVVHDGSDDLFGWSVCKTGDGQR